MQELHEEETQWVNYDEDELFVKMQLADGIFEALIRDTIQVLQSIQSKKNHLPSVWFLHIYLLLISRLLMEDLSMHDWETRDCAVPATGMSQTLGEDTVLWLENDEL